MPVRKNQSKTNTTYFVTFTCHKWIPIIDISNSYQAFDKWFEYLKAKAIPLFAYVTMPNHFHGVIHVPKDCRISINKIVGNGKRFIAYEIINKIKTGNHKSLIKRLKQDLSFSERSKKQQHKVFISSFHCEEIKDEERLLTIIDYIHANPIQGKWNLTTDYTLYPYSSAGFYELQIQNQFITHYKEYFG